MFNFIYNVKYNNNNNNLAEELMIINKNIL